MPENLGTLVSLRTVYNRNLSFSQIGFLHVTGICDSCTFLCVTFCQKLYGANDFVLKEVLSSKKIFQNQGCNGGGRLSFGKSQTLHG